MLPDLSCLSTTRKHNEKTKGFCGAIKMPKSINFIFVLNYFRKMDLGLSNSNHHEQSDSEEHPITGPSRSCDGMDQEESSSSGIWKFA